MKNEITTVPVITDHAFHRLHQRNGWNRRASTRMVERIYREGARPDAVKGILRKWVEMKASQDPCGDYVLYGQSLYVFRDSALITTFPTPTRKRLIDIKEGRKKAFDCLREEVC